MRLLQIFLLPQILFILLVTVRSHNPDHCPFKCGNVTIHYPFGTKKGCYKDMSYYIKCDPATKIPYLNKGYIFAVTNQSMNPIEVIEITLDGHMRVNLPVAYSCYNKQGNFIYGSHQTIHTSRFPISGTLNKFVGLGCDILASVILTEPSVSTWCNTNCEDYKDVRNGSCDGGGCCKSVITGGMTHAKIMVKPNQNRTKVWSYSKCGYGFIVDKHMYNFSKIDLGPMTMNKYFPVGLEWSVGNTTCKEAQKDKRSYLCKDKNSVCLKFGPMNFHGYRCHCAQGYRGNPYVTNGCQDVNECENPDQNDCLPGLCQNTIGSFTCVCPNGQLGNAKIDGKCTPVKDDNSEKEGLAMRGIGEGVAGALLTMVVVFLGVMRQRNIKGKKDFFKQNGGLMLQKMFSCKHHPVNKPNIFTEEELMKATDNFNDANFIGQGGYGTVYKGILANKTLVAIKKSKLIDQSQIKQFVNELIILSQINHPHIVKLLGYCLETHVPLLVYEYVTNNTLRHHLHMLTFEKRLKIAIETAEALAYMHSTTQIIHRDVKPSNILLTDAFTVKVSDFGISTLVPHGQTHLSTMVKGTIGYLDPEYFRTGKLTEKSDVYSFGVVLVELLTGTEIHSLEISLTVFRGTSAYFTSLMEQNALDQVLDEQLKRDEYAEVVKCIAKIAISCLDLEGKRRPTMAEVKHDLEQLQCQIDVISTA
ncbi:wall-associated receptor kinase 5-like [Rutidosis leptorrhynchoides]|uniref:wall-associated receptor kinase 5-like n=1 Tax=Rutidosis leptorrhynchoides TaxID=125765 RepID=UPI003A994928